MRKLIPNLLIVYGAGRNIGKTALVKTLINYNKVNFKIAAIKVSPHFHDDKQPKEKIWTDIDCNVYIENEINKKDSSLFLQAGANPVYYVETKDYKLEAVFNFIVSHIGDNRLIISESGILGRIFKPGLLIFIESSNNNIQDSNKIINRDIADLIISVEDGKLEDELNKIKQRVKVIENNWKLI